MIMKRKIAFITGATSGIGKACAYKFAENGFDLVLAGRRTERLLELQEELSGTSNVRILAFDISNSVACQNAWESLDSDWQMIDVLVNNAGLARGLEPIHEGFPENWDSMIDTNLKGLLYVTRLVSTGMVERHSGHIINIGSIAGKEAYLNGNVYCATKFAVDGLSRAMRIDLLQFGIRVSAIHPGMVETEFSLVRFAGDESKAKAIYQGLEPLSGEDVAGAVMFAVNCPAHVNISDMVITPTAQAGVGHIIRNQ